MEKKISPLLTPGTRDEKTSKGRHTRETEQRYINIAGDTLECYGTRCFYVIALDTHPELLF